MELFDEGVKRMQKMQKIFKFNSDFLDLYTIY